jgi:hypothetical protein
VALIEINRNPDDKELRAFGVVCLAGFGLIGSIAAWRSGAFGAAPFGWHRPWELPIVLWTAGVALAIIGVARPLLLRRVYVTWMTATYPIGWLVSHALLAVAFFGVFGIVAAIFRVLGYDPLERRFDRQAKTYWIRREARSDVRRYFRQF